MQTLIVSGKLPCTKDECATLAAIQLRVYELSYKRMIKEEHEERKSRKPSCGQKDTTRVRANETTEATATENERKKSQEKNLKERNEAVTQKTTTTEETKTTQIIKKKPKANEKSDAEVDEEDEEEEEDNDETTKLSGKAKRTNKKNSSDKNNKQSVTECSTTLPNADSEYLTNDGLTISSSMIEMPILTNNSCDAIFFYLKSCSCFDTHAASRVLTIKQLVAPNYQRTNDMMKLIKDKKERLGKTSYFDNEVKLKEYYVKMCRNLNCFGSVLFLVKEIIQDTSTTAGGGGGTFRKVKRLLVIKPNKILLIDYKTKALVRMQKMGDLKSWYSGDGYYNLTPIFFLNSTSPLSAATNDAANTNNRPSFPKFYSNSSHNFIYNLFRSKSNMIDMNKLFVIEFRDCKWYLQIDDFHSLKSITCILLDQSLDMGIDSNPLMLDLTISEHFQNRYKLFSPDYHGTTNATTTNNNNRNGSCNPHYSSHVSTLHSKKRQNTQASRERGPTIYEKKSAVSNNSNSQNYRNTTETSPSVSILINRNHSMIIAEPDCNSDILLNGLNSSFSIIGCDKYRANAPISSIFNSNGFKMRSTIKSNASYKYDLEFQELQLILLWFPEEVAIRLTEVEYELFKQVPPIEYLRHATLDMNNFKTSSFALSSHVPQTNKSRDNQASSDNTFCKEVVPSKSVQDLIVRYKEVSSWIKKLIQSQSSTERRLAIILSAIRCAITCWNLGNFNSSREIWLGLK